MMKERPILFQGAMVRALLEGRKTQTRRVMKVQPAEMHPMPERDSLLIRPRMDHVDGDHAVFEYTMGEHEAFPCPYGGPGDRLWVRETWSQDARTMYPCPKAWYAASDDLKNDGVHCCPKESRGRYADCLACWEERHGKFRWRPSIHMRRELSRITLKIENVWVERLNEICEEDAIAEGIDGMPGMWASYSRKLDRCVSPILSYRTLWESINDKPGKTWDKNPWVWVVEFKRA